MAAVLKLVGVFGLSILLAACGGGAAQRAPVGVAQAGSVTLEQLAPQQLERGHCGLYIWSQGAIEPVFILVAEDNPARARIRTDGRERTVDRTAFAGAAAYGHFENQTYASRDVTLTLEVAFNVEREMRNGAVLRSGMLRIRDREGWETLMQVGGMVACRS